MMLEILKLDKPIAFIDVETTGTNPYLDRIVELSIYKIHPDGREEYKSHRVNPGVPIPPDATAIHHITDSDVADEPDFRRYAKSIRDFINDCDIGGFNVIKFDLPCLEAEFMRANVEFSRSDRNLVDSMVIFHQRERRDLEAAYRKYCGGEMDNAHCAEEDAKAAAQVLEGQLQEYGDLPRDVVSLGSICYEIKDNYVDTEGKFVWNEEEAIFSFGKYSGKPLRKIVEEYPDYLEWILDQDFSPEVKRIVTMALGGELPQRK